MTWLAHRTPRPASHVIPIHWAGMALETCAAAGTHADGLMLYLNTPARYRRAVERFRRAATEAGRDLARLPVSLLIPTFIHEHLLTARQAAVSYTHLRAHETPEHLVCRLLLEKK